MDLNKIDCMSLNPGQGVVKDLHSFNQRWNTDIQLNKKLPRFMPGTFDKVKKKAYELSFPQRNSRRLDNVLTLQDWSVHRFKRQILKINDKLARARQENTNIYDETEGKALLDRWLKRIEAQSPHFNGFWELSTRPYVTKGENGFQGTMPVWNNKGEMNETRVFSPNFYADTDPRKIYLNMNIRLKDIVINLVEPGDAKIPFGDIHLQFCGSLQDLLAHDSNRYSFRVMAQTYNQIILHPYIKRLRATMRDNYMLYGRGNVCFGTFDAYIESAFKQGRLADLEGLLYEWASYFPWTAASPLNNISYAVLGIPKNWDNKITPHINYYPERCKQYLDRHSKDKLEEYCNNCLKAETCSTNLSLNVEPVTEEQVKNNTAFAEILSGYEKNFTKLVNKMRFNDDIMSFMMYFNLDGKGTGFGNAIAPNNSNVWNDYQDAWFEVDKHNIDDTITECVKLYKYAVEIKLRWNIESIFTSDMKKGIIKNEKTNKLETALPYINAILASNVPSYTDLKLETILCDAFSERTDR